ncbi:MAG: TonB-dependent receptor [Alphaproteobacteria bacterium]|nr:TonB-dependent receptor [Alphaproteobacteria bacterium]
MTPVVLVLFGAVVWTSSAFAQNTQNTTVMPETVVTATGREEPVTNVVSTVQVIDGDKITKSTAKSVTDLLAENAVGFMSQWTQGQTSLNIRGGATEGQGRDFKSEVLVLINGHRAGTANISKLSTADVERIEIVRGPASVVYGSQNMGGVVNIILKTGRTAPGTLVEMDSGSFGLIEGKLQNGGLYKGVDWYLGLNGGKQDDYQVGGGQVELNTAWSRMGGTGALGWQIDDDNRLDMTVRTDGVYNTGFRGSGANIFAFDTRYNQSIDVSYNGKTPDGRGHLFVQGYYVQDVDDLNNPSPLSNLNAPASRTWTDHNHRMIDIEGVRFQPRYKAWSSNELLVGVDWERSWITSYRFRAGGPAVTQLSPQDNNETDNVWAVYAEDSQTFFDDRLIVRGGVRQTWGTTTLLPTPNAPTLIPGSVDYQATTYSAGAILKVTDWMTTRFGASSGFRAPTATELGANFTVTPIGNTIFGNPNLSPERSNQLELGGRITTKNAWLDLALFQNVISNRIQAVTISSRGGVSISQYQNNPGDILVQGLELQGEADIPRLLGFSVREGERWSLWSNGYYNFSMTDYGAALTGANSSQATRINQYGLSIGTRYSRIDGEMPWSVQLHGVLRGPMWYNTEEALSPVYFPGQVRNVTVYEKGAFWVLNTRFEIEPHKGVTFFAAVNNLLDANQDPIFIALDQNPCRANLAAQNGSCGNSMMGREVVAGVKVRF